MSKIVVQLCSRLLPRCLVRTGVGAVDGLALVPGNKSSRFCEGRALRAPFFDDWSQRQGHLHINPSSLGKSHQITTWVPFWIPTMIRHLIFRVRQKIHNFDNHPHAGQGQHPSSQAHSFPSAHLNLRRTVLRVLPDPIGPSNNLPSPPKKA